MRGAVVEEKTSFCVEVSGNIPLNSKLWDFTCRLLDLIENDEVAGGLSLQNTFSDIYELIKE